MKVTVTAKRKGSHHMNDNQTKNEPIMKRLHREADYALNCHSRDMAFQTYGKACMAFDLGAITFGQYMELQDKLIKNGVGNPAAGLK